MFSSLASFLFGSNTSATTTNSEENLNQSKEEEEQQQQQQANNWNETERRIDAEQTIEVTSSTPSVTGATSSALGASTLGLRQGKRSKNKRNKQIQKSKRQGLNASAGAGNRKQPTNLAKLLTPNDSVDEDIDEDDWYIVEKEDEEESLPRTDSEEEISVTEVKPKLPTAPPTSTAVQRRRVVHINSHSLYSGPRPQQQRNSLQRARQSGARLSVPSGIPILSPQLNNLGGLTATSATIRNGLADVNGGGMTQSLYVASSSAAVAAGQHNESHLGANCSMDESWYVTPPPCFTSIGPIDMETSPFENLLIEHPSMSVYHSIRSAQEATESFVNLDLGVNETQTNNQNAVAAPSANEQQQQDQVEERTGGRARIDRQSAAQLKQELLARTNQKNRDRHERQKLCRGALKRANAVRDYQGKGNRQRRSDMQHCKINSGANNNRKCCF